MKFIKIKETILKVDNIEGITKTEKEVFADPHNYINYFIVVNIVEKDCRYFVCFRMKSDRDEAFEEAWKNIKELKNN